jgi:O-antigen/teichoic acid export membrane protein
MTEVITPAQRRRRFAVNVIWNWGAVAISVFTAFFLSRYVIRKLGDENYGMWALTASLAEYYWIMDLGFRSATVKFSAHYHAIGESDKVNEILNTALFYSACVGPLILAGNYFLLPWLTSHMQVHNPLFPKLVTVVVAAWVLGSLFNVFTGCLEGFQRFDMINRIALVGLAVRSFATAALLFSGYGVFEMALVALVAQVTIHILSFFAFRRVFPQMQFSRMFVKLSAMKTMLTYGSHSVVASIAQRVLNQGAPLMIGYFLPAKFVGYYAAPSRLLDYCVDGIGRIGMVSNPNAAQFVAQDDHHRLINLSVITNRYGLAIFLPVSIFLIVYGPALLSIWINPTFANASSGVLVALVIGITLGQAGQYNSGSILFGMGRHQAYSRALVVEALVVMGGIALAIPRFGVTGAACVIAVMLTLNRGAFTAFLISRELKVGYGWFMASVYQPLLAAIPALALLFLLRGTVLPGHSWFQVILGGAIGAAFYSPLAFFFSVRPDHRELALAQLQRFVPGRRAPTPAV